ncbi:MAG: lycopene cyclase domain-containing protein [Microbacteriaceae bacterium]
MSGYLALNLAVIAGTLVLVLLIGWWLHRTGRPPLRWSALALTAVALVLITALFDNIMIAVGLFSYAPSALVGLHLGLAPLEDFAYPLVAALLMPTLWQLFDAPRAESRPSGESA